MDFELDPILKLAVKAGLRIKEIYNSKEYLSSVSRKSDNSPLTIADLASDKIIASGLSALYPEVPLISEERPAPPYEERKSWKHFWLVDPLDGTEDFLQRTGNFTVNIALIERTRPVLGVIYLPLQEVLYFADASGAFKQLPGEEPRQIQVRKNAARNDLRAVESGLHLKESERQFIKRNGIGHCRQVGSAIKFCMVAEGEADVYYQGGHNWEWDTAAGQAIVERAGGAVVEGSRKSLSYNKPTLKNSIYLCTASLSLATGLSL
jgi:3'(2'), 5'-bisphosphate nucleotidase